MPVCTERVDLWEGRAIVDLVDLDGARNDALERVGSFFLFFLGGGICVFLGGKDCFSRVCRRDVCRCFF